MPNGKPAEPRSDNGLNVNGTFRIGRITLSVSDGGVKIRMQQAGTGRDVQASDATVEGVLIERFFPPEDGDETASKTSSKETDVSHNKT